MKQKTGRKNRVHSVCKWTANTILRAHLSSFFLFFVPPFIFPHFCPTIKKQISSTSCVIRRFIDRNECVVLVCSALICCLCLILFFIFSVHVFDTHCVIKMHAPHIARTVISLIWLPARFVSLSFLLSFVLFLSGTRTHTQQKWFHSWINLQSER